TATSMPWRSYDCTSARTTSSVARATLVNGPAQMHRHARATPGAASAATSIARITGWRRLRLMRSVRPAPRILVPGPLLLSGAEASAAQTHEGPPEHVVGDAPALGDAQGLVVGPVDAQVDAALAVFLLGLGQRGKPPRDEQAPVALVVEGLAVELVGHERERDAIGPVDVPQH